MRPLLQRIMRKTTTNCGTKSNNRRRLKLEPLEERTLLTAISVVNDHDAGTGSLRQAILDANGSLYPGEDEIIIQQIAGCFSEANAINLNSPLPIITEGVTIRTYISSADAYIDGRNMAGGDDGFIVSIGSGETNEVVRFNDLRLVDFDGDGFYLAGAGLDAAYFTDSYVHEPATSDGNGVNAKGTGIKISTTVDGATVSVNNFNAKQREVGILHNGKNVALAVANSTFYSWGFTPTNPGFPAAADKVFGIKVAPVTGISGTGTGNIIIGTGPTMGNTFKNLAGTGIYLDGNNGTGLQAEISHNTIGIYDSEYSLGRYGILAERWQGTFDEADHNSFIEDNDIRESARAGIELRESRDIKISNDNEIFDNNRGIIISDPYVSEGTEYYTEDILLDGNNIHDNSSSGIRIESGPTDSKVTDILIQENIVSDNSSTGIYIDGSAGGEISTVYIKQDDTNPDPLNNKIEGNAGYGVYISGDIVYDIAVVGQTFSGNGLAPIRTADADVYGALFYENEYTTAASIKPIDSENGSNHGLNAPVIDGLGIVELGDNWYVSYSLDTGGYAGFEGAYFVIQKYLVTPGQYDYEHIGDVQALADGNGNIEGWLQIEPPSPGSYDGKSVAFLATWLEGGQYVSDTSEFSNVVPLVDNLPFVTKIEVGNSNYMYEVATNSTGNDQLIPVMPDANDTLDGGIDRVKISFNRPIDNDSEVIDALEVNSHDTEEWSNWPAATNVSYNWDYTEVTWEFSSGPYEAGEMILQLSSTLIEADGIDLDGEWDSPENWEDTTDNDTFDDGGHSGNGAAGGDFVFNFTLPNTLGGDADRDGDVDLDDLSILGANYNTTVWPAPGEMMGGGGMGGESLFDDDDRLGACTNFCVRCRLERN